MMRQGVSQYKFKVGDRLIRRVESSSNKVAKVYDWNPKQENFLLVFEIDELAFIDGGLQQLKITLFSLMLVHQIAVQSNDVTPIL